MYADLLIKFRSGVNVAAKQAMYKEKGKRLLFDTVF